MKIPNLDKFTAKLIKKLKEAGFHILYYKSFNGNSYYIKLDYGLANTIRVSDHKGKSHLKYRYNIGQHISTYEQRTVVRKGWPMYFYPLCQVDVMIKRIINLRDSRIKTWGKDRYNNYMEVSIKENQYKKGFWTQSKEV